MMALLHLLDIVRETCMPGRLREWISSKTVPGLRKDGRCHPEEKFQETLAVIASSDKYFRPERKVVEKK